MTQQDYEQKKRECLLDFCTEHDYYITPDVEGIFGYAFDRAYALGKEKETITQEEIEKTAEKYTERAYYPVGQSDCHEGFHMEAEECLAKAFKAGANFALGKKIGISEFYDTEDSVIQGWVAVDNDGDLFLYRTKPARDEVSGMWMSGECPLNVGINLFPDLTWDSDPLPVEIIIKRKKNG